jgi:outer membrane cobalamin receptor
MNMKTTHRSSRLAGLFVVVAACLLAGPALLAADKPASAKKAKKAAKAAPVRPAVAAAQSEAVVVTGSRLPVRTRKRGVTTSPVCVIDGKAIQNSGAGDLTRLLNKRIASR